MKNTTHAVAYTSATSERDQPKAALGGASGVTVSSLCVQATGSRASLKGQCIVAEELAGFIPGNGRLCVNRRAPACIDTDAA